MRGRFGLHSLCAGSLAWLAITPPALATGTSHESKSIADESSQVAVVIACGSRDCPLLQSSVEASLGRVGLRGRVRLTTAFDPVDVARAPREVEKSLAAIWLDARGASVLALYLVDYRRDHVYSRSLPLESRIDSVATDLLELILDSSLKAVQEGHALGVAREHFARAVTPPSAPEPRMSARHAPRPLPHPDAPREGFALGGGYLALMRSASVFSTGPVLDLAHHARRHSWLIEGGHLWATTVPHPDISAELSSWNLRARFNWMLASGKAAELGITLGGASEWSTVVPKAQTQSAELKPAFWVWEPILMLGTVATLSSGAWKFEGSVRSDWLLKRSHYEIEYANTLRRIFVPWRFRPVLGLQVTLIL